MIFLLILACRVLLLQPVFFRQPLRLSALLHRATHFDRA